MNLKINHSCKDSTTLTVVGSFNFVIASNLLLNCLTQNLLSLIKMVFPIYFNSFLKSWHFLGDIFNLFLSNTFNESSNFDICNFFFGVNNNKSSTIALQYFLLCKQCNIAFMYDYHIDGDIFNLIDILLYRYEALPKYHKIPQNLLEFSKSLKEWNASFKSKTNNTSHLELHNTKNVSLSKG